MSVIESLETQILKPLNEPLSIQDIQYSDEYIMLEDELKKMQAVIPEEPNWQTIRDVGVEILGSQGKHLKVMTYVMAAYYKLDGLKGLLEALGILAALLAQEQNQILPTGKRAKSREAMLVWFAKFISDCRELDFTILTIEALEPVVEQKKTVQSWYDSCLPDADALPILALYDLFIEAYHKAQSQQAKLKQQEAERIEAKQKEEAEEIERKEKAEAERVRLEEEAAQKQADEAILHAKAFSAQEDIPAPLDIGYDPFGVDEAVENIFSSGSFIDVMRARLLDNLDTFQDDMDQLSAGMMLARQGLWSSVSYQSDLLTYCEEYQRPLDFDIPRAQGELTDFEYLIELERAFLKAPFLLEIQFLIVKQLEKISRLEGEAVSSEIRNQVLKALTRLLNDFPDVFDARCDGENCVPGFIHEWIWVDVLSHVGMSLKPRAEMMYYGLEGITLVQHLDRLSRQSNALNQQLFWVLQIVEQYQLEQQNSVALDYLYQKMEEFPIHLGLLENLPELSKSLQLLVLLFQEVIAEQLDNEILVQKQKEFLGRLQKAGILC